MGKNKKGMHIGHYYIKCKPITIVLICVIVLALIAGAVWMLRDTLFGGKDDKVVTAAQGTIDPIITATPANVIVTNSPTPVPATPTPEPTTAPTPTPEPAPRSATLRFLGEIAVDENVLAAALQADGSYSFAGMLATAAGAVGNADYTIANVEGSMGGVGEGYTSGKRVNTPEVLISDLADIGVDMLTLANDHALDAGFNGLLGTITHCQESGLDYVGAAQTQEEHDAPKLIDVNGINVCFLNYTTTLNSMEKDTSADATKYGVNLASKSNSVADAKAAREAGADVVIAIISWSEDGATKIDDIQKKVAKILLDSDVDAIIGYGPRNIQSVLWLDDTDAEGNASDPVVCAISLGSFLNSSTKGNMDAGTIFQLTITENNDGTFRIEKPVSIPTYVWQYTDGDKNGYRVLVCGEWLEEQPEGMSDEAYARLKQIWEKLPGVVSDASSVEAN